MNDRSSSWYIIGDYENGDYVSIDFSREKAGWCYDSSFGGHGVAGSCEIVAKSFTEFLQHCLLDSNKGEYVYWEHPNFISLGDAYD